MRDALIRSVSLRANGLILVLMAQALELEHGVNGREDVVALDSEGLRR